MSQNVTNRDPHPLARAIKTARVWSGKTRAELGQDIGVSAGTIGRWERGDWKTDQPRNPMLIALAKACDVAGLVDQLADLLSDDPATRFAAAARAEAQPPGGHPRTIGEGRHVEGAADAER